MQIEVEVFSTECLRLEFMLVINCFSVDMGKAYEDLKALSVS